MPTALEHIRVLDFTRAFAGPLCTELLAQLGAEVIKIEMPGTGDGIRSLPPRTPAGEGYVGIILNRGKKSITLRLSTPRGSGMAKDLAAKSDVIVENFGFGVMERFGLGYETIRLVNPTIIFASASGYGHTGPKADEPALDSIAQAAGGLMAVNGFADRPPLRVGIDIADYLSGIYTTIAILAALQYRDRTGEGQAIDMSMQDIIWSLVAIEHSPGFFLHGKVPERTGNGTNVVVPSNNYPTRDGYVRISGGGKFDKLMGLVNTRDQVGYGPWSTIEGRIEHRAEIDAVVEQWTSGLSTKEVLEKCKEIDTPCSVVPAFDQVVRDPQLLQRGMIVEVDQPVSGKVKVPGTPFKMTRTPAEAARPAPRLGEHNREVYQGLLGLAEEQLDRLQERGVI